MVRLNRDSGQREIALLRWGLVPFWAKDAKVGYTTINARAEEAAAKPAYREAMKKRRCLVPADAFYEWQRLDAEDRPALRLRSQIRRALRHGRPVGELAAAQEKACRSRPSPF